MVLLFFVLALALQSFQATNLYFIHIKTILIIIITWCNINQDQRPIMDNINCVYNNINNVVSTSSVKYRGSFVCNYRRERESGHSCR